MLRRAFALLLSSLALTGCMARFPLSGYAPPTVLAPTTPGGFAGTAAPAGQRVAILLPLSGARGDVGQSMLKAAQLAMDAPGAPPLDPKDTHGTSEGAAAAAQEAIAGGAGIILGPLTSIETAAVAPVARQAGVAVLAFTNDPNQAQPGVWTLGITPGQQVRRLVAASQAQGRSRFAALLPDSDFGRAMSEALQQATSSLDLPPPAIRQYGKGMAAVTAATRDIADYANRGGTVDAQVRAARARGGAEGRRGATELSRGRNVPPPPFDALLLADTGEPLAEIGSLLPYYDISRSTVRILGPALWANPSSGSGQFTGAWYAAPDPAGRAGFDQSYNAKYNAPAPAIADLAFDAAAVARVAAGAGGFSVANLTQTSGFAGADGLFALQPDGRVRRALALFEVQPGGNVMVEPAPQSLTFPGV